MFSKKKHFRVSLGTNFFCDCTPSQQPIELIVRTKTLSNTHKHLLRANGVQLRGLGDSLQAEEHAVPQGRPERGRRWGFRATEA